MTAWPSVGVVVPTAGGRPGQLAAALNGVLAQDYKGRLRAVVVFDGAPADHSLAESGRVDVLANTRTPGLAGARNTGILACGAELVAFCDDDDRWLPGKLTAQVSALLARPEAEFASCSITVLSAGRRTPRLAGRNEVSYADLLRSRMAMVHSSTFLTRVSALLEGIGLVDESIPGGQNEDWDLVLRAAGRHPIVHIDEPLVEVTWDSGSHFAVNWETKAAGLRWMLDRHAGIAASRPGAARVYAQLAFSYACLGRRTESFRWAGRALRRNWHERRVPFALAVACGAVSGERVLKVLHARGHGI